MPAQIGYYDTLKSIAGKVFSYLASITITGTDGKTLTVTDDVEVGQAWTTPAFDAGNFAASGSMTWTVAAGNVVTYAYIIIGKVMTVKFWITGSTVGGTPDISLNIKIPASKVSTKDVMSAGVAYDNGAYKTAMIGTDATGTDIWCRLLPSANWTGGTTRVHGQITFEIN